MHYKISPITKAELQTAMLEWAKSEGWHYSQFDVESYFTLPSSKILSLKLEKEFIGCVILTKYNLRNNKNDTLGSVGLYLVKKEFRGKLIGSANETPGLVLWKQLATELQACKAMCLNSIAYPKLQAYYGRKGYVNTGKINLHLRSIFKQISSKPEDKTGSSDYLITAAIELNKIINYENKLFIDNSTERNVFIENWLSRPDAIYVAYHNNQIIEGYGVLTTCHQNQTQTILRLSPAYADSIDVAAKILSYLFNKASLNIGVEIELNIPAMNLPILNVLQQEYGFISDKEEETTLMATAQNLGAKNEILLKTIALSPLEFPHEFMLNSPCDVKGIAYR